MAGLVGDPKDASSLGKAAYATSEPNEISSKMTCESDELIVRGQSLTLAKAALLFSALALSQAPVTAQYQYDPDGEFWNGNFYPWVVFPHGHIDCEDGSTERDLMRIAHAEVARAQAFNGKWICSRGIVDLIRREDGRIVICKSDGKIEGKAPRAFFDRSM